MARGKKDGEGMFMMALFWEEAAYDYTLIYFEVYFN
jgi:hypothetical protein